MASTTSSTSHPKIRFDVFLSFRGEDTRHTFTDHLYHSLLQAGLRTFRDNDEIDRGQELKPEIETAIIESRASIVVLSENYVNSTWCLDELCLILEQRKKLNHFVLPIFYHVNPTDVRNQRGSFAIKRSKFTVVTETANLIGFSEKGSKLTSSLIKVALSTNFSKKRAKWTEANVGRWKASLTEIANLAGMELSSSRSEPDFITEVVDKIQRKLDLKQLSTTAHFVGMEAQVEDINYLLKDEQNSAIAIFGMGGSGKTTLAQHIYNLNKHDYESCSFIQDIGKQPNGLLGLQIQLLKDVMGGKKLRISSVSEGTQKIEEVLQMKRMLVVLDDIDQPEQLSALLGTRAFPTKSKIIITTRIMDIKSWFNSISWRCFAYEMNVLNDQESIELLSLHAFQSKTPMTDFKDLAIQLAQYCGGNPLALMVLGSSLRIMDEDPMTLNYMKGIWRSRMNLLNSLKGNIDYKIQGVLRKSLDSLPQPSERELFLHIACFFVGKYSYIIETILEDELSAKSGILTLVKRCLVTASPDSRLMMHHLLQEMGKNVVCEESKDPAKRSRVWHDAESYSLLKKGDGSETIEGLSLDMRNVDQGMRSKDLALETTSLANMSKLKLLQLKYVKLTGSYENFPELIWLCWHGCPLQTIPSGLLASSLVAIDMSHGDIEMFEAPTVLNSLKILNLNCCEKLVSICNLHRLSKLEELSLRNCSSLNHICKSLGDLQNLECLKLEGCTKLCKYVNPQEKMMLPEQPLLSLPQSLESLLLSNCGIQFNSDVCVVFHAQSHINLNLAGNPFEYLPNNIDLKMLRILNLYCCPNLKSLPCIPRTLEELYVDWCTSLESVAFQSGRFTLQGFSYEGCFKLLEVQGLFKLVSIANIDEKDLGHMQSIKAYENHKVDLVGDEITKGKIWQTQMLYEYGITSTYLQGIKDQSFSRYEYTTFSDFLTFLVPPGKNRTEGLNVSCLYRASGSNDDENWCLFAKIRNITKDLTWVYNPIVYGKPRVDEDVVWLSYWPIGNTLDAGDEVSVNVYVYSEMMTVSGCGASLVYMVSEVNEEQKCESNSMKYEVIGGDLSEFEVATGCYYLCRHDLFGLTTSDWLKFLFGDNVHYPDTRGWRKTYQSDLSVALKGAISNKLKIIELGVSSNNESEIGKIEKAVSGIAGVESVSAHKEIGKLTVIGHVDPVEVVTCLREFDSNIVAEITSVKYIVDSE